MNICPILTTNTVVSENGEVRIGTQPVYCLEKECAWYKHGKCEDCRNEEVSEPEMEFKVGDIIDFTLTTGEKVSAMAMRQEEDGMLFVFVDCLDVEYPMFENPDRMGSMAINYYNSDLRHKLNNEILNTFPDSIRSRMKVMRIGDTDAFDFLRLLTKEEVFGENRLEPMKEIRNRIAFQGRGTDRWEWWWLQDRVEKYASGFASVTDNGVADYANASFVIGVRPAFKI